MREKGWVDSETIVATENAKREERQRKMRKKIVHWNFKFPTELIRSCKFKFLTVRDWFSHTSLNFWQGWLGLQVQIPDRLKDWLGLVNLNSFGFCWKFFTLYILQIELLHKFYPTFPSLYYFVTGVFSCWIRAIY